jgi:hypothetical protein
MSYDIRPLSFGEILDQSFKVLKDHFKVLFGICAVLYVPFNIVSALFTPQQEPGVPPALNLMALGGMLVALLLFLLVIPLTQMAVTQAVSAAYLSTPLTIQASYKAAGSLFGRYVRTIFIVSLALIGLALLLIVPAIYFGLCWSLVGPILAIEGLSGRAAMRRSRALMKGFWWRTAGVFFVIGVLSAIVGTAVQAVVGAIPVVGSAFVGTVQAVSAAFSSVSVVVLYVDLRCRVEDFDLQRLAEAVKAEAAPNAPATPAAEGA